MNLKRKYVFVYFNRIELCSTPEQAIYFINSLINPRSAKQLKCSETAECRIYAIFFGEIVGNEAGTVDYFIYNCIILLYKVFIHTINPPILIE